MTVIPIFSICFRCFCKTQPQQMFVLYICLVRPESKYRLYTTFHCLTALTQYKTKRQRPCRDEETRQAFTSTRWRRWWAELGDTHSMSCCVFSQFMHCHSDSHLGFDKGVDLRNSRCVPLCFFVKKWILKLNISLIYQRTETFDPPL